MIGTGRRPFVPFKLPERPGAVSRLLITVTGLLAWAFSQSLFGGLFGFIGDFIPRYALAGFLALFPVTFLWFLVPRTAGVLGRRDAAAAAASTAALFIPFMIMAARLGLRYGDLSLKWPLYAGSLLLLAASEEVLCRGFLMDSLSFRKSRLTGLLLSSALFAALHIGNESVSTAGIANIFLVGAMLGFQRIVTDGLWYPVAVHWLWNLMTGMIFGWSVSGHAQMPTVFRPLSRPPWGGFGPEESVLMTISSAGAVLILLKRIYSPDDQELRGVEGSAGGQAQKVDA